MSDILSVEEAAKLLGCSEDTLREKTPAIVPGVKFGRDWIYSRALIVEAVERESRRNLIALREKQDDAVRAAMREAFTKGPPALTITAEDVAAFREKHGASLSEAVRELTKGPPPSLTP